jgi:hypothetical protein
LDSELVQKTLEMLRREGLHQISNGDLVQLLPDTLIWTSRGLYITRPLTRRGWLTRTALRDAERIVRDVHRARKSAAPEAA